MIAKVAWVVLPWVSVTVKVKLSWTTPTAGNVMLLCAVAKVLSPEVAVFAALPVDWTSKW